MTESRARNIILGMGYQLIRNNRGHVKPFGSDDWFPSHEAALEEIKAVHAFYARSFNSQQIHTSVSKKSA